VATVPTSLIKTTLLFVLLFVLKSEKAVAQSYSLSGTVVNTKLEPIPFINVRVKELQRGARTNANGEFTITLPPGRYELILSSIGYQTLKSVVVVREANVKKRFILETATKEIKKVVVTKRKKDRSKEIIRKVIQNKKELQKGPGSYSFEAYIKATADEKKKAARKGWLKKVGPSDSTKKKGPTKEFAEVYLEVSKSYPDKIKEKRTGVNIKGNKQNFFYLSCTEGDFDFYDNLILVRALGQTSFLSPFSTSGLVAYRYKYKEFLYQDGHMYHRIQFRPSATSNALLRGEVLIQNKTWAIKKITASFPQHQTPEYKKFEVTATYDKINNKAWLPRSYDFNYLTSAKKQGRSLVSFSNYKIDTTFDKKHFSNELSATSSEAYERDSSFWKKTRPVPLSTDEIKIIRYRDSIYEVTHSDQFRDSLEKENNKIKILNILWHGQDLENWRKERFMTFPSLVQLWNPIAIGGQRFGGWFRYRKKYKDKKEINFSPSLNYGPLNKDFRGRFIGSYLFNPFTRSSIRFDVGRSTSNLFWNDAIINLFNRSNYFLKDNITVGVRRELINGLFISNTVEMGYRRSMHNLKLDGQLDSILFNREVQQPIYFENYAAFFNEFQISYRPAQKYIREPYEKVILGSRYPTFYAKWRKGIPGVFKSIIKYDYLELGATQEINMGTLGLSTYNVKYGNFVSEGNVEAADFKFIARGNPGLFFNPLTSFQAMDSTFALFKGFAEAHYLHQFNGALLNKIPHFHKLKIFESAGAGFLIAPERNLRYIEAFAGLEKRITILKQPIRLGLWGVASYANQFKNPLQLKFSIRYYNFQRDRWE
jgi:hypothetical protein